MCPLEEIDECEESVAGADIAGTRTTLQPAHHMTNFVPAVGEDVLPLFPRVLAFCRRKDPHTVPQNPTIDPRVVID
jgi:hypothetical protein